ncbi:MAG: HPP family protein [Rhizobiaceae bacterium]|nr:HPP family protein [Rhizobiaceae bacterium]
MTRRFFVPILAGATLRDRVVACFGAVLGIGLTGWISSLLVSTPDGMPLLVAPMGASAVLLFAVPSSPLAQPWPIVGGNTISAFIGVAAAHYVRDPVLATGLAVALAIAAMSLARCLHPPGGAAALTAALASPAVASAGFMFPLVPVALNSVLLVALGMFIHKLTQRNYPHLATPPVNAHATADPPAALRGGIDPQDVDAALAVLGETFDIDRADVERLVREVELQALVRSTRTITCTDIMSKDVISVGPDDSASQALRLLLDHNIRTLPVVDADGKLLGTVGLRELVGAEGKIMSSVSPARTASPDAPAMSLLPLLTDGRSHAVVIVDEARSVIGLITQTDLLAAAARLPAAKGSPA